MEKRTHQVGVRLTEKELEKLDRQVRKSGLSRSSYLRDLAHRCEPRSTSHFDYAGYTARLKALGERIAQVARVANSTGYIMVDEYKAAMEELMQLLDEIVAEAEKPLPQKPVEPPTNPRVWRPRKPQVSKRQPKPQSQPIDPAPLTPEEKAYLWQKLQEGIADEDRRRRCKARRAASKKRSRDRVSPDNPESDLQNVRQDTIR